MLHEMQYFNLRILESHLGIILRDDMSKELELGMNWLISGERFTNSTEINSGLSKDEKCVQ